MAAYYARSALFVKWHITELDNGDGRVTTYLKREIAGGELGTVESAARD